MYTVALRSATFHFFTLAYLEFYAVIKKLTLKQLIMKNYATGIFTLLLLCASHLLSAQETPWKPIARGQSDKGYWVVEAHKEIRDTKLISFYTKENTLMYKEELSGDQKINTNKEKSIKKLDQLLNSIALQWEKEKAVSGEQIVYNKLKQ